MAEHLQNQPSAFQRMERLEQFGIEKDLDFVFIPKQESKSNITELIVTDPIEGIHISRELEG